MALTINTNVAALNAHMNMKKTDNALTNSLQRLSTGMRINKAADDASGMAIADSLKAQGLGLGQAIRNANDGINIVQTADGALDEAINIVNIIKTKAIQAAQDGQTFESRKIIQEDIDKLLEEVDLLANSTSFNGKKLLSGEFTNKNFQVGSSSGEIAKVSIDSAETTKTGHVTTGNLTIEHNGDQGPGETTIVIHSSTENKDYELQTVDLLFNNSSENGIGALADAVNKLSDKLGITAQTVVEVSSRGSVKAFDIGADFKINGVDIGAVSVKDNDSDGALAKAINGKSDQTGVRAAVDSQGVLTLSSADGRAIKIQGNVKDAFTKTAAEMSTFGELRLTQMGSNSLLIKDADAGELTQITIDVSETMDVSTEMLLAQGSDIASGSVLTAGSQVGFKMYITSQDGSTDGISTQTTSIDSSVTAGSKLASGTVIAVGTTIGGKVTTGTLDIDNDAKIAAGSTIASGSTIAAGTLLTTSINTSSGVIAAGTLLSVKTTTVGDVLLEEDLILQADTVNESQLASGTTLAAGSVINNIGTSNTSADGFYVLDTVGTTTISEEFTLKAGSELKSGTVLAQGSTIGNAEMVSGTDSSGGGITATDMGKETVVAAGSKLLSGTSLEVGSTIGGTIKLDTASMGTTISNDLTLGAGSTIASGSVIAKGTYLTTGINTSNGIVGPGVTLEQNATLMGDLYLTEDMTLEKDSVLLSGTTATSTGGGVSSDINIGNTKVTRLSDIDVTSQESAQIAISVADSALKDYDKIRANLGSVQNQLTSTISNISVTQVNVNAAESAIRDVDFADESKTFSKLQILAQSGSYAMSQANASSQNVMSLLQ